MTVSSALHQAAVHAHEPAPFQPAFAVRPVFRLRPARAFGVVLSTAAVLRSVVLWARGPVSSLDLRAALPGAARLLGGLLLSACQGLQRFAFAYPISQTGTA